MALEQIIRGLDKEIEFTLQANEVVVDPSGLIGILIYLYYNENNVLDKFSKNTKAGHKDVITGYDDSNGNVKILLESSKTKNAKLGYLFAEVKLQAANLAFENGTFNDGTKGICIGEVVDSVSKNIDDLS